MNRHPDEIDRMLEAHLLGFFAGHASERQVWTAGPMRDAMPRFCVRKFGPGPKTGLWTYCSVGAWEVSFPPQHNRLELFMLAAEETPRLTELVTILAYYHRDFGLGRGHTLGLGEPWLPGASCESILVSTPYPFGPDLELCEWDSGHVHVLWALPITEAERALKISDGLEALEEKFDSAAIEYWRADRPSVV